MSGPDDARFEYAAPHYHDFAGVGAELDPAADVWFDTRRETVAPGEVRPYDALEVRKPRRSMRLSQRHAPVYAMAAAAPKRKFDEVDHAACDGEPRPLTVPKSPRLMTRVRAQLKPKTAVATAEERELQELQSMPKFKALPLDRRIFESSGDMGVPRVQKHSLTEPQPFKFATDHRLAARHQGDSGDEAPKPPPHTDKHRNDDLFADETPMAQQAPRKRVTEPEPFALATDERGALHRAALEAKLQEEERAKRLRTEGFHARPADVLYKPPFEPARSNKPLTTIDPNVKLHSDFRSKERAKFDAAQKRREMEEEAQRKKLEAMRAEQEKRDVEAMRQRLVHKAKPMPTFLLEGPLYRPSTKALTVPASPMLSHKRPRALRS